MECFAYANSMWQEKIKQNRMVCLMEFILIRLQSRDFFVLCETPGIFMVLTIIILIIKIYGNLYFTQYCTISLKNYSEFWFFLFLFRFLNAAVHSYPAWVLQQACFLSDNSNCSVWCLALSRDKGVKGGGKGNRFNSNKWSSFW